MKHYLLASLVRLGIVTPDTAKGTAFEKHRRSDTGTVVEAKMLDIENVSSDAFIVYKITHTSKSVRAMTASLSLSDKQQKYAEYPPTRTTRSR